MSTPLLVVGAVITDKERILAARRRPELRAGGLWEFPGGKVEPGESPQQALARELSEELGVRAQVGGFIGRGVQDLGERELHLDCYWVRLLGDAPRTSTDHDLLRWCTPAELTELTWAAPDRPIVQRVQEGMCPMFEDV